MSNAMQVDFAGRVGRIMHSRNTRTIRHHALDTAKTFSRSILSGSADLRILGLLLFGVSVLVVLLRVPHLKCKLPPPGPSLSVDRFLPGRELELPGKFALLTGRTDPDPQSLATGFRNRTRSFPERLESARQLALLGSPSARRILMDVFLSETREHQLELARMLARTDKGSFEEALGKILETGTDAEAASAIQALAVVGGEENVTRLGDIMNDPGWPTHLRGEAAQALLQTRDEQLCRLAIRGMATIGTEAETGSLAAILHNPDWPQSLRVQAAVGLGKVATPRSGDELIAAFSEFSDEDVQGVLLDALGHFPFLQIAGTWRAFLDDPSTPNGLRVAAAEALANSSGDAVPFLESLASSDRDADVREMAAWALSTQVPGGTLGPRIADMIRSEAEPDVRRRLYESLLVQAENPSESVLPIIQQEEDPAARVAAMNAVGDAVGHRTSPSLSATFDSQMVPELQSVALGNSSPNLRMRAVFALRRAATPASLAALQIISTTPTTEIATAARNGLQASR